MNEEFTILVVWLTTMIVLEYTIGEKLSRWWKKTKAHRAIFSFTQNLFGEQAR